MANYYGMLIDGLGTAYLNGFAYNSMRHLDEEQVPLRFARAEEVFQEQALARAASRMDQVESLLRSRRTATCRPSTRTHFPTKP